MAGSFQERDDLLPAPAAMPCPMHEHKYRHARLTIPCCSPIGLTREVATRAERPAMARAVLPRCATLLTAGVPSPPLTAPSAAGVTSVRLRHCAGPAPQAAPALAPRSFGRRPARQAA